MAEHGELESKHSEPKPPHSPVAVTSDDEELEKLKPLPASRGGQKRMALMNRSLRKRPAARSPSSLLPLATSPQKLADHPHNGQDPVRPKPAKLPKTQVEDRGKSSEGEGNKGYVAQDFPEIKFHMEGHGHTCRLRTQGSRPPLFFFQKVGAKRQCLQVSTAKVGVHVAYKVCQTLCTELNSSSLKAEDVKERRDALFLSFLGSE